MQQVRSRKACPFFVALLLLATLTATAPSHSSAFSLRTPHLYSTAEANSTMSLRSIKQVRVEWAHLSA
jgi:hypothetical protein